MYPVRANPHVSATVAAPSCRAIYGKIGGWLAGERASDRHTETSRSPTREITAVGSRRDLERDIRRGKTCAPLHHNEIVITRQSHHYHQQSLHRPYPDHCGEWGARAELDRAGRLEQRTSLWRRRWLGCMRNLRPSVRKRRGESVGHWARPHGPAPLLGHTIVRSHRRSRDGQQGSGASNRYLLHTQSSYLPIPAVAKVYIHIYSRCGVPGTLGADIGARPADQCAPRTTPPAMARGGQEPPGQVLTVPTSSNDACSCTRREADASVEPPRTAGGSAGWVGVSGEGGGAPWPWPCPCPPTADTGEPWGVSAARPPLRSRFAVSAC